MQKVLVSLASMLWGLVGIFYAYIPGGSSPIAVFTGRSLVGSLLLGMAGMAVTPRGERRAAVIGTFNPLVGAFRSAADRKRENQLKLAAALSYGLASALLIVSLQFTSQGVAILLSAAAPLYSVVLGRLPWIRERHTRAEWIAAGVAMADLAVVLSSRAVGGERGGAILAILSGVGYALSGIWVRRLPSEREKVQTMILGNGAVTALRMLVVGRSLPLDAAWWIPVFLMGSIGQALPQSLYCRALSGGLSTYEAQMWRLLQPLFAFLFGCVLLRQIPSLGATVGMVIVLGALCANSYFKRPNSPKKSIGHAES